MKHLPLLFMFLVVLSTSCTRDKNPVSPINEEFTFLGEIGTQRTYTQTETWLDTETNKPYTSVPEALLNSVSLTEKQIENGVNSIRNYTEIIEPIEDDVYNNWDLKSPLENYRLLSSSGTSYSLIDEVESLMNQQPYSPKTFQGMRILLVKDSAIMTVNSADLEKTHPSVPFLKNDLRIKDTWVRDQFTDESGNHIIHETIAEVISKENITVPAGTFETFKIKLKTYHYDGDYDFDRGYEYYVPNIGLVLEESDLDIYRLDTGTNETIHFRKIRRKELVSYHFVQ